MLGNHAVVTLIDAATLEPDAITWPSVDLLLVLTSTYGSGKPPESAARCAPTVSN